MPSGGRGPDTSATRSDLVARDGTVTAEPWVDLNRIAADIALQQAETREGMVRAALTRALPRRTRWLLDHPRSLKLAFKLRPSWKPLVTVGQDGDCTVEMLHTRDGVSTVLSVSQRT